MKIFLRKLNQIAYSKAFCFILIILSVIFTVTACLTNNIIGQTLSSIGESNSVWFLFWGIFTSFSVLFNVRLLMRNLNLKNRFLTVITFVGSISVIITSVVYGDDPFVVAVHWATGITFGVLCFLAIFSSYFLTRKTRKAHKVFIAVLLISAVIDIIFIFIWGLTALCEVAVLLVCQVCIFISNNILKTYKTETAAVSENIAQEKTEELEKTV